MAKYYIFKSVRNIDLNNRILQTHTLAAGRYMLINNTSLPHYIYMSSSFMSAEMFMSSSVPVMSLYSCSTSSAQASK